MVQELKLSRGFILHRKLSLVATAYSILKIHKQRLTKSGGYVKVSPVIFNIR